MNITGSCHCGQIQYSAKIDPNLVRICHCTDCQKLSGSAFRVNLPVPEKDFALVKGKLNSYTKQAASGRSRAQLFCGNCGSQIYATSLQDSDPNKGVLNLRVGTIDQRSQLPPMEEKWASSKLPWIKQCVLK